MKVRVVVAYQTPYLEPIELEAGEIVRLGGRDEEYPGWIWTKAKSGREGWAPASIFEADASAESAIVLENYSARELDTSEGEELVVRRELSGWYWVLNSGGNEGWVPKNTVSAAGTGSQEGDEGGG